VVMQIYKALLLDSSYYPIQIIDWKKAMILFFTGRAEVVEHHEDINIRSTSESFRLPSVLRLFQSFKNFSRVKFNRNNVFARDKYLCQYCGDKFSRDELTFDHVMPKSRGGATNWHNIVTSCHTCNNKKADRTPEECGFTLLKKPKEPIWHPLIGLRPSEDEISLWKSWILWKESG
jgi:5-methylcytosine-specific restriction endonuclease McrA